MTTDQQEIRRGNWVPGFAAIVCAVAVLLLVGGLAFLPSAPDAKAIGLPFPHVTLNKASPRPYGPTTGCRSGQTRPTTRQSNIVSEANLGCFDYAGYKIVSMRATRRLYARGPYVRTWHVYSRQATVTSRRWEGSLFNHLSDHCGAGEGVYWYEVRQVLRVEWSHPSTGASGVARIPSRIRSQGTIDCGGWE